MTKSTSTKPKPTSAPTSRPSVVGVTYSVAKTGKTLGMLRAFPGAKFLAPNEGCVLPASYLGFDPNITVFPPDKGLIDLAQAIQKVGQRDRVVVVDDLSVFAFRRFRALKKTGNNWQATDILKAEILDHVLPAARAVPAHVFFTAHVQPPKVVGKEDKYIKGCPLLAGWQLPEQFPGLIDLLMRVVHTGNDGWPYAYKAGPDEDYVTGDRLSITPDIAPMNLREVMLQAGYELPRPEQFKWMEQSVEVISKMLLIAHKQDEDKAEVLRKTLPKLQQKTENERHIRWVWADAFDRAVMKLHQQTMLERFLSGIESQSLTNEG